MSVQTSENCNSVGQRDTHTFREKFQNAAEELFLSNCVQQHYHIPCNNMQSRSRKSKKKICLQCDLCSYLHNTLCPVSRAIQALHIILSFFFNCRKVNFFINGLKWFPKEKVSFCMHKMVLTFWQRKTERTADCMLWNSYFKLQLGYK